MPIIISKLKTCELGATWAPVLAYDPKNGVVNKYAVFVESGVV
jgi:hypothetical protein